MMPFAGDNQLTTSPISGGVEISGEKYKELLSVLQSGGRFQIQSGEPVILSETKIKVYSKADKSEKEISENEYVPEGYTVTEPDEFQYWDGEKWKTDDEEKFQVLSERVRSERDAKLAASDWSVLPDSQVENIAEWKEYRQKLRNMPDQEGFPENVEWPLEPQR